MATNEMDLREEDRLPWLETVEPEREDGPPLGRVLAMVLLGLAVLAAIIFGIYKLQTRTPAADGQVIPAQDGDYKIRPDDPGGLKVKGEGNSAIATSAGKTGNGAIDLKAVPEAPVAGHRAPAQALPTRTAGSRDAVVKVPAKGGRLVAAAPLSASRGTTPGAASGGSLVQLGAYPTEAAANAAWSTISKRFAYVAALGKSVESVASGGRTLYRLRVNAGSANQAADVCGRLKVAGESCFVAS